LKQINLFRVATWCAVALTVVFILCPLALVFLQSFNPQLTLIPKSFTLKWYTMQAGGLGPALRTTVLVSVPAVLIGLAVSLPLGYAMARCEFRGKEFIRQLILLPIVIPGVVLGLAYLQLVNSTALRDVHPIPILIAAHTIIVIPYAARSIIAGYERLDRALEEASATLGGRPALTFWRVTLPSLMPAVFAGGLLGFSRSVNDFVITLFLIQPGAIPLSVQVYQTTQYGIPQLTSAVGTVLLICSLLFTIIAEYVLRVEVQ